MFPSLTSLFSFLQVLGKSLYIFGKYLDYKEKYAMAKVGSLSVENESLRSQISTLAEEPKKDKEHLKTLEKSIDTKKALSKLKGKQVDKALLKVEKAGSEAVEQFKAPDEYLDKLCDYYVEGFNLFCKYLAKHHPGLDLSKLDMEEVEREILADHPAKVATENDVVTKVTNNVPTDLSPSNLP